ncbi:MAG: hypothetical protein JJ891_16505 [Rhizobiaceae bacterium]|jgi:opacity protein-like surface antigen|nr:hypothetical protein [Rhizobiaceae bacterium]
MKHFLLTGSLAAFVLGSAGLVQAGDYGSGYVSKTPSGGYTDVEFGSGWYIRGDISYNIDGRSDQGYEVLPGTGGPTAVDYDDGIGARIGFGNYVTPNLRMEVTAEGLFNSEYGGVSGQTFQGSRDTPGGTVTFDGNGVVTGSTDPAFTPGDNVGAISGSESLDGSYSATAFMVSGYVDLASMGNLTPYVGGGVGVGQVRINESRTWTCNPSPDETCGFPSGQTLTTNYEKWRLAYRLSAGAAYRIDDKMSIDVGYSYSDFGGDDIEYSDGSSVDMDGFAVHQIHAGIRYDLW